MEVSHDEPTAHVAQGRARRLQIALGVNLVIVVAQVIVGFAANSLGLLSDAGHNLTDVAGLGLALVAVQLTRRPATAQRSFGWHRGTILAAQANAAMILALTVWIVIEGVQRLFRPPEVDGMLVIVVAAVAFVANAASALVVREPHAHGGHAAHGHDHGAHDDDTPVRHVEDLNMRAAMLHLVSDAAASLGVVAAGIVIVATGGWNWLDPAVSLLIGASIGVHAWRLLRSSNAVLLEGTPEGLDTDELRASMVAVAGVEAVHDLHVWAIASHFTALSAHIVVRDATSLAHAQAIAAEVRAMLVRRYGIDHSTLELEEVACAPDSQPCEPVERATASAPSARPVA